MSSAAALEDRLAALLSQMARVICAIDGRAAAGKTTLAASLARRFDAAVVHADDFFLRPEQRTPERLAEPGGNFDRERFLAMVLRPLSSLREGGRQRIAYRPFDCRTGRLADEVTLPEKRLYIVEGSYSLHPELRPYYDLAVFVTTDPETQLRRVEARDASKLADFTEKWIPLEERYFAAFGIEKSCDIVIAT